MVENIRVRRVREDVLLEHPIAGRMPDENVALWPADQTTFRFIRDGDIARDEAETQTEQPSEGVAHLDEPAGLPVEDVDYRFDGGDVK